MAYYNTCQHCNASLDPGEKCDCTKARAERRAHDQATKKIRKVRRVQNLDGEFPINMRTA